MSFDQSSPAESKHSFSPSNKSENVCIDACNTSWHPADAKYPVNPPERNANALAEGTRGFDAYALLTSQGNKSMNDGDAKSVLAGGDVTKSGKEMSSLGFPTPELVGEKEAAKAAPDTTKDPVNDAAKDANKDALAFCSFEDRPVSPNRQERGERALGRAVMEHLKDQDWLIAHQDEVRRAISRAWMEVGMSEFKSFMDEIEKKSDGNLYCVRGNGLLGSLNPLNPPGDIVWRVYLKRGILHPDTLLLDSRTQTQCSA